MKKNRISLLFFLLVSLSCFAQEEVAKIAILGTFHYGQTNDMNAMKADDLTTAKRQQELELFTQKLATFKPNKIMIEWEPVHHEKVNREFQQYLKNEFKPENHEVYQIAFRVADKSGIEEILPIDHKMDLGDADLMEYLEKIGKMTEFGQLMAQVQTYLQEESDFLKEHSITEFYIRSNSEETDKFNRNMYLEVLPRLSKEPGNPLLAYAGNWYKRNIFIMGNIDSHLEPGDRVLILTGNAHRAVLKDLYKNRDTVEYVEISDFLK